MILLLISDGILAYTDIFFLCFGGSRWTSDMAINYYKTVLGVAVTLLAMVLLVGISKTFLDDYYLQMNAGSNFKNDKGDLWTKVANYHSTTPHLNAAYWVDMMREAAMDKMAGCPFCHV